MLVLGLVLIVAAIALGAGVVVDGGQGVTVDMFGATFHTTVFGIFFAGAAAMLVFMLGVLMLVHSMGRSRRKRAERKGTKRRQRESVAQLEQERTELRAENERLTGRLGDSREPDTAAAGTTAGGATDRRDDAAPADRDDGGRTDLPEGRDGRPMRESDGPSATGGSHARDTVDGPAVADRGVDLRQRTDAQKDASTTT
jgi:hypothetical protein